MKITLTLTELPLLYLRQQAESKGVSIEELASAYIVKRATDEKRGVLTTKEKAESGMFLSLRELALVVGFDKDKMCTIARKTGFPLFEGKVRLSDFDRWVQGHFHANGDSSAVIERSTAAAPEGPSRRRGMRSAAASAR